MALCFFLTSSTLYCILSIISRISSTSLKNSSMKPSTLMATSSMPASSSSLWACKCKMNWVNQLMEPNLNWIVKSFFFCSSPPTDCKCSFIASSSCEIEIVFYAQQSFMMLKSLNMNLSVSLLNGDNSKLNITLGVRTQTADSSCMHKNRKWNVRHGVHPNTSSPKNPALFIHIGEAKPISHSIACTVFFLILIICAWYTTSSTTTTISNCTTLKVMPSMLPIYISTDEIAIKRRQNNNSHWWWCLFLHKHFYVFLSRLCGAWEAEMDRNVGIILVLAPSTSYVMDPNSQFL